MSKERSGLAPALSDTKQGQLPRNNLKHPNVPRTLLKDAKNGMNIS